MSILCILQMLQFDWDKVSPTFPALRIEWLSLAPTCNILTTRWRPQRQDSACTLPKLSFVSMREYLGNFSILTHTTTFACRYPPPLLTTNSNTKIFGPIALMHMVVLKIKGPGSRVHQPLRISMSIVACTSIVQVLNSWRMSAGESRSGDRLSNNVITHFEQYHYNLTALL